ncbi:MAG: hypothetical protein H6704_19580 [Myxococcales bacterium]|nr:hypothetical protein [Myxococcales bacterium]
MSQRDAAPDPPDELAAAPTATDEETIDVEEADDEQDLSQELSSLVGEIPWTDQPTEPLVIAFAGGKGGAGRSLLAANVGLLLSRLGREVVVADLDPGGSNLHTYLGLEPILPTPGSLLRQPGPPRIERLSGTHLSLCRPPRPMGTGADDPLRAEALQAALDTASDVVILDLGAQADPLTLDTYLAADAGIVVVLPEPVAVERSYAFLRAALYRRLMHGDDEPAVVARALLAADQVGQLDTPADLVDALEGVHPNAAAAIRARVMAFNPKILINKCRARADRDMGAGMVSAVGRRLGINAEDLGGVEYDDAAWEATRRRRPLLLEYPGSTLGNDVERMARRLLALVGARELRG